MKDTLVLEYFVDQQGYMLSPIDPTVGYFYNRRYGSLSAILYDFKLKGWKYAETSPDGYLIFAKNTFVPRFPV